MSGLDSGNQAVLVGVARALGLKDTSALANISYCGLLATDETLIAEPKVVPLVESAAYVFATPGPDEVADDVLPTGRCTEYAGSTRLSCQMTTSFPARASASGKN